MKKEIITLIYHTKPVSTLEDSWNIVHYMIKGDKIYINKKENWSARNQHQISYDSSILDQEDMHVLLFNIYNRDNNIQSCMRFANIKRGLLVDIYSYLMESHRILSKKKYEVIDHHSFLGWKLIQIIIFEMKVHCQIY